MQGPVIHLSEMKDGEVAIIVDWSEQELHVARAGGSEFIGDMICRRGDGMYWLSHPYQEVGSYCNEIFGDKKYFMHPDYKVRVIDINWMTKSLIQLQCAKPYNTLT